MRVKLVLKNMSDPMRQLRLDMPRTMLPMSVTTITFCLLSAMGAEQAREGGVIRQGKAEQRQGRARAKASQSQGAFSTSCRRFA